METSTLLIVTLASLIVSLIFTLVYEVLIFLLSLKLKRNDVADVFWGLGFVLLAFFWLFAAVRPTFALKLALLCIAIWGIRLTLHIGERFLTKKDEDRRYKVWRDSWKYFKIRSFFQIYLLQGLLMVLIMLPYILHVNIGVQTHPVLILLGFILWSLGFYFQFLGDHQLKQFISNPKNKGKLMKSGLWKHSRHPNYFGEMTMWWGIFIILTPLNNLWYVLIAFMGPIIITLLLRYVSGVPMLEKYWEQNYKRSFNAYKKTTPMLIPYKIFIKK